jgi:hypothetical protein
MICALVACALAVGSQTYCDRSQPQKVQYIQNPEVIATQHECDEVFKIFEHVLLEHGVSMRRREWYAEPKEPKDE